MLPKYTSKPLLIKKQKLSLFFNGWRAQPNYLKFFMPSCQDLSENIKFSKFGVGRWYEKVAK